MQNFQFDDIILLIVPKKKSKNAIGPMYVPYKYVCDMRIAYVVYLYFYILLWVTPVAMDEKIAFIQPTNLPWINLNLFWLRNFAI